MLSQSLPVRMRLATCCKLMSETMEGLRDKFFKWKEAFESKDLKVSLE